MRAASWRRNLPLDTKYNVRRLHFTRRSLLAIRLADPSRCAMRTYPHEYTSSTTIYSKISRDNCRKRFPKQYRDIPSGYDSSIVHEDDFYLDTVSGTSLPWEGADQVNRFYPLLVLQLFSRPLLVVPDIWVLYRLYDRNRGVQ